ncbi:hypothetical protein [Neopusillimonas aromaticivorans]|uniref:hypothetical protein n=1 Tax=Neopusillimonas aromaticivorans TaxID=2979868 RepID=UPI00259806CE|nr:hypothetical protein [Neopusillimonas aromaticivorans]WJJ92845.1 hypothetical protein N7E01_11560 [Neopusillimonas aromaticivorans]
MYKNAAALGVALALSSASALADVKVGIIISGSGPLASLGIPFKNTFSLLPDTLGANPSNTFCSMTAATRPTR